MQVRLARAWWWVPGHVAVKRDGAARLDAWSQQLFQSDLAGAEGVDHCLHARAHGKAPLGTFDVVMGGGFAQPQEQGDLCIARRGGTRVPGRRFVPEFFYKSHKSNPARVRGCCRL